MSTKKEIRNRKLLGWGILITVFLIITTLLSYATSFRDTMRAYGIVIGIVVIIALCLIGIMLLVNSEEN